MADGNANPLPSGSAAYLSSSALAGLPGSQLAIFYAGSIHVFDSITPEKAQAIMLIATAASAAAAQRRAASSQSSTTPEQQQQQAGEAFCKLQGELPLARRNSLQRFLEKRRERCLSMAPYSLTKLPQTPPESCSGNESSPPLNSPNASISS